ncbi:MAG: glycosyltransferase family 39 protein [Chloroflexota bacterium]
MNVRFDVPIPVLIRLLLILFIFLLLVAAHTAIIPLGRAPDELWHFRYMNFITEYGRLPVNDQERVAAGKKSDWPPLYHGLVGAINSLVDSEGKAQLKIVENSGRVDLASMFLPYNMVNTYDELWPYTGEILRWRLSRLFSGLLSVVTIVLVFLTAREVFQTDYYPALLAAAFAAFIPTFIFISAVMSDDPLIGVVGALYLLALLAMVTRGYTSKKYFFGLGLLMGLAIVAKYSALILPLSFAVIITAVAFMRGWRWRAWLARLTFTGLGCALTCGWWFAYLMINFNEIEKFGPVLGLLKPVIAGNMDRTQNQLLFTLTGGQAGQAFISKPTPVWEWAVQIFRTYWSMMFDAHLPNLLMLLLVGWVCIMAVAGLIKHWLHQPGTRLLIVVLALHFLFLFFIPLIRFFTIRMLDETAQGRHILFPAAVVTPILILYGWQAWGSPKIMRHVFSVVLAGLLLVDLGQIISLAQAYSAALIPVYSPQLTLPVEISQPLELQFGDRLKLVGYTLNTNPPAEALDLSLYWQTSGYLDEDYTRRIRLAKNDQTWLEWTSYPTNARYPVRIWEPGEIIVDELALPLTDLPPAEYHLQIQLRSADGPLRVNGTDFANLGPVEIPPQTLMEQGIPVAVQVDGQTVMLRVQWWRPDVFAGSTGNSPVYAPRMVIPLVWQGDPLTGDDVRWNLIDGEGRVYPSTSIAPHFAFFTVGADWISGEYNLSTEVWRANEAIAAQETPLVIEISNSAPRLMTPPPIPNRLEANFANRLQLLGYHLPQRALTPGQPLPVTLYWQSLRTMPYDFSYALRLFDENHHLIAQMDRAPQDDYNTSHWLENEVVIDQFNLTYPNPQRQSVIAWLDLNVYLKRGEEIINLPLVVNQQLTEQTSVTFGPVKIGGPPPGVVTAMSPAQTVEANFAGIIGLRGYDGPQIGDRTLTMQLYWQSLAPIPKNYTVFVHVRDQTGAVVAQMDRPPANGIYPTSVWSPPEIISEEIRVSLPTGLLPGDYAVVVGLYDPHTGERLLLSNGMDEILLTRVNIKNTDL